MLRTVSSKSMPISFWQAKKCVNCKEDTNKGNYVKLENDKMRQRWVCDSCTNKGFIPKKL